jgi:hypothetical protein
MRFARGFGGLALALVVSATVVLSGCGGGGGGGSGAGSNSMILLITAQGITTPLWQNVNGTPTPPPVCPDGVFINSTIVFTFGGAVDPASLPQTGVAVGSINIVVVNTGQAALGTFTVADDPLQQAGNHRRVIFSPTPPGNPNSQCASGLASLATYQISVPRGGNSPQVVVVDQSPIANDATTCFITCGCPSPGNACLSSFTDPVPGSPYVVSTTPSTSDPPPAPIDPGQIPGNTITILISEALNPAGINLANVKVVNSATGNQVPGSLNFFQAGSIPGLTINSRIDYVASSPLLGSATYEVVFSPAVQDFGGNPIQTSPTNPAAHLFFQTVAVTFCPQPAIDETFDTIINRGQVTGEINWSGTGMLFGQFPITLTGTGADGVFNPPVGTTTLLDTNQLVSGQSRAGLWNFTNVTIAQNATVRVIGPFLAHFRCTGTCTINGLVQAIPGQITPPVAATPAYDRGPEIGQQNNNLGMNCEADGGVGNAGGGRGGAGSGITPPPGSPTTFQCNQRAFQGEDGYGASINGAPNNAGPNPFYAGGQGGISGCFPSIPPCTTVTTELGGLGGAGGTAGRQGDAGLPRLPSCQPNTNVTQQIAQARPVPTAMIPPISMQSAGSGGGGGGDKIDPAGVAPTNDDQGGGGGGAGGGLRISCVGAYTQGATGTIVASGKEGGNAPSNLNAAAGGSGSGGEVWIQSFSTVTMAATATIAVVGAARLFPSAGLIGCTNQASGAGGPGLVQIEAGTGPPPTASFNLQPTSTPTSGAVFSNPPFQYAGGVTGQATSLFFYTGYGAPDYTSVQEISSIGNAPGATLSIRYEGAPESVNSTAQNPVADTSPMAVKTMATGGGPITAANIDELDGYAFIRFVVNVSFPPPPTTPQNAILPSVDRITINYNAALNCP